jgi:hypothetical protein
MVGSFLWERHLAAIESPLEAAPANLNLRADKMALGTIRC